MILHLEKHGISTGGGSDQYSDYGNVDDERHAPIRVEDEQVELMVQRFVDNLILSQPVPEL